MKNGVPGDSKKKMGMQLCYPCLGFEAPHKWEDKDEDEGATALESDEVKVE